MSNDFISGDKLDWLVDVFSTELLLIVIWGVIGSDLMVNCF